VSMLDPLLHQETRLRIVAALHRNGEASFATLAGQLKLTPGNLGSHAKRLEDAGYVFQRHAITPTGIELRYRLTAQGTAAFLSYLDALRELVPLASPPASGPKRADDPSRAVD
jgi:DNA-binding MarR family transcriptional regulator